MAEAGAEIGGAEGEQPTADLAPGPESSLFFLGLWVIREWLGVEGASQGHLVQPPAVSRDIFH